MSRPALVFLCATAFAVTSCSGNLDLPPAGPAQAGAAGQGASSGGRDTRDEAEATPIPSHIRKLTNAEYEASVASLLGFEAHPAAGFADDVRNGFFTPSILQRVDETRGDQLQVAAEALAKRAVSERLSALVPCNASEGASCAQKFIDDFATRAFRRPLIEEERSDLLSVFMVASNDGTFADGVEAVIRAVLQSASFLYIPSLGTGDGTTRALEPYEIASALSYFVIGASPDDRLLAAAAQGALDTAEARVSHFERLLRDDPRAKVQVRRFLREWLGIDRLDLVSPVSDVDYVALRPHLEKEADAFIDEVLFNGGASLKTLIAADFTMANGALASHYALNTDAPVDAYVRTTLRDTLRRGLLMQGAFLSAHASRDHSSPVKRGATVLNRLLCRDIAFPTGELASSAMVIPPPSPNRTTRERFVEHSVNPVCKGCHRQIDPLGFAFENFDWVGRYRETENGKTVDASGELVGTDVDGAYANGAEFVDKLSQSEDVRRCFARNLFRFASAVSSHETEESFLTIWQQLSEGDRDDVLAVMRAYVGSDLFVTRRAP